MDGSSVSWLLFAGGLMSCCVAHRFSLVWGKLLGGCSSFTVTGLAGAPGSYHGNNCGRPVYACPRHCLCVCVYIYIWCVKPWLLVLYLHIYVCVWICPLPCYMYILIYIYTYIYINPPPPFPLGGSPPEAGVWFSGLPMGSHPSQLPAHYVRHPGNVRHRAVSLQIPHLCEYYLLFFQPVFTLNE